MSATEGNNTPTHRYISELIDLKHGDRGRLRMLAGQPLNETVAGFDLFAGLWWPIRQSKDGYKVPRREVAWLIAKIYGYRQVPHTPGLTLARQLSRCWKSNKDPTARDQLNRKIGMRFDTLLTLPVGRLEPQLQWALAEIQQAQAGIDWVQLTDDLSGWHRSSVRQRWVDDYLNTTKETTNAD